jgi:protein transport protein DSL1/ZW10
MMPDVMSKLVMGWLNSAIPPALKDVDKFESVIEHSRQFCSVLEKYGYSGWDDLRRWVDNAPAVWLAKCREVALDSVRSQLSSGIGAPKVVEKIERQMVSMAEAHKLAATSSAVAAAANNDDWDAAWIDEGGADEPKDIGKPDNGGDAWRRAAEGGGDDTAGASQRGDQAAPESADKKEVVEDDTADAWGWGEGEENEEGENVEDTTEAQKTSKPDTEEGDEGDAWGWGDETAAEGPSPQKPEASRPAAPKKLETREMVLKETYHISSMPEPVLGLISAILEDGAALTQSGFVSNALGNFTRSVG